MMKAAPAASFVVVEPQFMLEILIIPLNSPAQFGPVNQIDQGGRRRQGREPVLARLLVALWPLIPFRKCCFVSILSFRLTFVLMASCWSSRRPRHDTTMGSRPDVGAWRGSANRVEEL